MMQTLFSRAGQDILADRRETLSIPARVRMMGSLRENASFFSRMSSCSLAFARTRARMAAGTFFNLARRCIASRSVMSKKPVVQHSWQPRRHFTLCFFDALANCSLVCSRNKPYFLTILFMRQIYPLPGKMIQSKRRELYGLGRLFVNR